MQFLRNLSGQTWWNTFWRWGLRWWRASLNISIQTCQSLIELSDISTHYSAVWKSLCRGWHDCQRYGDETVSVSVEVYGEDTPGNVLGGPWTQNHYQVQSMMIWSSVFLYNSHNLTYLPYVQSSISEGISRGGLWVTDKKIKISFSWFFSYKIYKYPQTKIRPLTTG